MKQTRKRIGSLLIAVCMVLTMLPTVAFAEEGDPDSGVPSNAREITAFADLAEDVALQEVESGTTEGELNLPDTFAVMVTESAITANVRSDEAETDSDEQKTEIQEKTTVAVSDWTPIPEYNLNYQEAGGNIYTFTPTLDLPDDTTLADGVTLPQITVTVKETVAPKEQKAAMMGAQDLSSSSETTSGTCGENVSWTFNAVDGVITISGNGPMTDYEDWREKPWHDHTNTIKKVKVESGVTRIGDRAFSNCTSLSAIVIPESVRAIGQNAFVNCLNLSRIQFRGRPEYPIQLNEGAFSGISHKGVLYTYKYGDSYTTVMKAKFGRNYWRFTLAEGNCGRGTLWVYDIITNVLTISADGSGPLIGEMWAKFGDNKAPWYEEFRSEIKNVVIESGVKNISDYAFKFVSMTNITISDSVTSIGNYAFQECYSLTSITIPDGVTSIGKDAFFRCESLTSVIIPDSVTSIDEGAFLACESLTNIKIPAALTSISKHSFSSCYDLSEITIPDGVTIIDNEAFSFCKNLTSVTIPDSVTFIGRDAFGNCTSLTSITFKGSTPKIVLDNCAFHPIGANGTVYCPPGAESAYETWISDKSSWPKNWKVSSNTVSDTYAVTVNSGTANPSTAAEGATVTITANTPDSGQRFKEWTIVSGGITLADAQAASTTFTMPANTVEVTATYEEIPTSVTPVTGVTLNKTALSLYSNTSTKTANLTATITPADATDKFVTWQSLNPSVATVDESGQVTAVGNGMATITVTTTDVGYTASCIVTVSTYTSGGSSSSGGGSGGGSSSGGTPTKATTVTEKQPNQPITAVASVTATAGTNGTASASISDKAVTDAIAKAQAELKKQSKTANGIAVGLNVTMPKGATTLTATLRQNGLNSLVSAGVTNLEINGAPIILTFDQKVLTEIQKQSSGNVNIAIAPQAELSKMAKALIGTRPVYNITVGYGNNMTLSSFGGGVATVGIPYTPANGEAIGGLYAVYVDQNGNASRVAGSAYDANSGCIIFTTTHFSMYGVGYSAPSAEFADISSHWAKESIDYVVGRGLLSGTSETTFAPNTAMTRGMLVTALGRLEGVDISSYTKNSFTDVKAGSTFNPYIEWAYEKGIIQGIGNNKFAPDRAITREEIAVIVANFTKATGYTLPVKSEATTYADDSSISSSYKTAVAAMQQAGIMMGGTSNKFNPKSNATRAEVSSMLYRYMKLNME